MAVVIKVAFAPLGSSRLKLGNLMSKAFIMSTMQSNLPNRNMLSEVVAGYWASPVT